MLNTTHIPARDLQKSYKSIINGVKTKNQAVILTTNQEPQVAIVSLEDLEQLKQAKSRQSAIDMLNLAVDNYEELKNLPADLRAHADEILYSK